MTKKRKPALTKYIALDGAVFETYEEKLQYEKRLNQAECLTDSHEWLTLTPKEDEV